MKTSKDPRHLERIRTVKDLFAWQFNPKIAPENPKVKEIVTSIGQVDKLVEEAAPAWPIDKINKVDLAILREAIFELMVKKSVPSKVVVDEAVEIAKEYGSDSTPGFVNGALGKLIESHTVNH